MTLMLDAALPVDLPGLEAGLEPEPELEQAAITAPRASADPEIAAARPIRLPPERTFI
jgi:hypothetical protein